MTELLKKCPICQTPNQATATICLTCGANLESIQAQPQQLHNPIEDSDHYELFGGELDLQEKMLSRLARNYLIIGVVMFLMILSSALFYLVRNSGNSAPDTLSTNVPLTAFPTINAVTVTLGPPTTTPTFTPSPSETPTATSTRGPCVITIPQGESLTWAVQNCGHRSLDVLPTVLALNNLNDASSVQANQQVLIPWPTETPDPNATATPPPTIEGDASRDGVEVSSLAIDESIQAFAPTVTPTLPAGVMWHQVGQGENIITIAISYSADVKVLSELNREIDFARCDFGLTFGGAECIVQLFQGQLIRVPAPTPTPTLSPTNDPNSTATPTATPTYNQPTIFSPADREFFYSNQLITLRWIPSATLNPNEAYRIDVTDLTANRSFTALTRDIAFTIPTEWQGTMSNRHEFQWSVGIVDQSAPESVRFVTPTRIFVWQGILEGEQ